MATENETLNDVTSNPTPATYRTRAAQLEAERSEYRNRIGDLTFPDKPAKFLVGGARISYTVFRNLTVALFAVALMAWLVYLGADASYYDTAETVISSIVAWSAAIYGTISGLIAWSIRAASLSDPSKW